MNRTAEQIRAILHDRFPRAFKAKGRPKVPLKIGIFHDLRSATPDISARELRGALRDYTIGPTYLRALVEGDPRFDLFGGVTGFVSKEHADYARIRLAAITSRFPSPLDRRRCGQGAPTVNQVSHNAFTQRELARAPGTLAADAFTSTVTRLVADHDLRELESLIEARDKAQIESAGPWDRRRSRTRP